MTDSIVKGIENRMNEKQIVTAFRMVVTVTAARAPNVVTSVRTMFRPKYPAVE